MPTAGEMVVNKRLDGTELTEIIINHVRKVMSSDGMLAKHVAYGRVGFEVTIKLHLDNPSYNEHVIRAKSQSNPNTPALESAPLSNPSPEAVVVGRKRTKKIDNPNKERVLNGIGIPIERRSNTTGHMEEASIKYSPDDAGLDPNEDDAKDEEIKGEWE
jgi:hypothetical protein